MSGAGAWRRGMRRSSVTLLRPWRSLTPLGHGVLVLGVVAVSVAVWLNWQEFTQLGVVALALLVLAAAWQALPGSPEATLVLRPNRLVEGGGAASVTLDVQAGVTPMLYPRLSLPVGDREVAIRLPFLAPYAHHSESVPLPALPRGAYDVGPIHYQRSDPVGLVSRTHESGTSARLLVSPRTTDLSVFAGGLTNDLDGATSQQLSMSDLAFHALREYVPGDDLRHVHWRSSAKAAQLLVRQYHETRRGHVTVLVDPAAASYPRRHDFELAVSVATSIALRAVRDDFDTYLRCAEHVGRGRTGTVMTDAACHFAPGRDEHLIHAAEAANEVVGTGLVVQVTGGARALEELDAAARCFAGDADWLVLRADSTTAARISDSHQLREMSVPDLPGLRELLAGGMR